MAWNQPGNNGQDNDPWGNKKKPSSNQNGDFLNKIKKSIKKQNNTNSNKNTPLNLPALIGVVLFATVAIWGVSGFYTITKNQRGVVTRLGKVQSEIIQPGFNWKPSFIDSVYIVDTQAKRDFNTQALMMTSEESLVLVEMKIQYQVSDPIKYFFNVGNVEDSLKFAANSALRAKVANTNMDTIMADGYSQLQSQTKDELINIITRYDMGVSIVDLSLLSAKPPKEIQDAFNEAAKAKSDYEQEIDKAEKDKIDIIQQAEIEAAKILSEAKNYQVMVEFEAEGNIAYFEKLLPEYKIAPEIIREYLYIQTMENILSKTNKVLTNDDRGNLLILPLAKQLSKNQIDTPKIKASEDKTINTDTHNIDSSKPVKNTENRNTPSLNLNDDSNPRESGRTTRTGRRGN